MLASLTCIHRTCTYNILRRYLHPSKPRHMNWSANVLTTVTSDTEPTVVVEFDSGKYIFNAGDNTNRAFNQSITNRKKTRGIFFSSVGTQRASGLSGLLMTLADAGLGKVEVIGPQGLTHFIAAMRKYVFRDYLAVIPTEVQIKPVIHDLSKPPDPCYKDENVTVYALPIVPVDLATANSSATCSNTIADTRIQSSSKRKRTPSPTSSSKRPHHLRAPSSASNHAEESRPPSIQDLANRSGFNPRYLEGRSAQQWRELMVQTIFSQRRLTLNDQLTLQASANKTQGADNYKGQYGHSSKNRPSGGLLSKPLAVEHNSTSEQGAGSSSTPYRAPYPRGFNNQLPTFSLQHRQVTNTPETKPTLAYAVVGPRIRGKFDAVKAKELGVPNGSQRRDLTQGKTIRFMVPDEKGGMVERVVRPEEIIGESENPSAILILDTPTLAHVSPLISSFNDSSFFAKFHSKSEDKPEYIVRVVFHLCGDQVLEDDRYKKFMNAFGADVYHVVASREHGADPVTFTSAAFCQLRLKQLDPEIFQVPTFHLAAKRLLESIPDLPPNTSYMRANTRHGVRPVQPPVYSKIAEEKDTFHPAVQSSSALSLPDLTTKRFTEAKSAVAEYAKSGLVSPRPGSDVVVTPLGTSSAVPTKYRNVSSTLIRIPKWGNILLDAGEGTWGQLSRHFGVDDSITPHVWDTLRDLKCIFISHLHADHHSGLAKILSMRCRLDPMPKEPLYLVAPFGVFLYLHEYSDIEDLGLNGSTENGIKCILSEVAHFSPSNSPRTFGNQYPWQDISNSRRLIQDLCQTLGLQSFATVDVLHTSMCHGAIIKHKDGWGIVFSGDTIPANKLVIAGDNATLLIHEASMADDQLDLATSKMHSTFGQAVDVGRRMHAENILLTHFSARYPQMPPSGVPKPSTMDGSAKEPILALAFDNVDIAIGDMWKMNFYLPAIEQSFKDTEEADDNEGVAHVEVDIP